MDRIERWLQEGYGRRLVVESAPNGVVARLRDGPDVVDAAVGLGIRQALRRLDRSLAAGEGTDGGDDR